MDSQNADTRSVTDTLKGIAISVVLINHYAIMNFSYDASGFASAFIALFFIASGYGLYYSLCKALPAETGFTKEAFFLFYRERAIRIFPLFWMALLVYGRPSLWAFLGLHASGHFWFIPALLQCYALAPLIFLGMRKNNGMLIVILIVALAGINFLPYLGFAGEQIAKILVFLNAKWRGLYFIYILLFTIGFMLPCFIKGIPVKHQVFANVAFCLLLVSILGLMIWLKYSAMNRLYFLIMPLPALVLLFIHGVRYAIEFRMLERLGGISYSVYLFHMLFYKLIGLIGFSKNSLAGLGVCIALLPLFLYGCSKLERLGKFIAQKLKVSITYPLKSSF